MHRSHDISVAELQRQIDSQDLVTGCFGRVMGSVERIFRVGVVGAVST